MIALRNNQVVDHFQFAVYPDSFSTECGCADPQLWQSLTLLTNGDG